MICLVGLQLRTALKAQFAEGYAHAKESLKNYKPENSSLGADSVDREEKM